MTAKNLQLIGGVLTVLIIAAVAVVQLVQGDADAARATAEQALDEARELADQVPPAPADTDGAR